MKQEPDRLSPAGPVGRASPTRSVDGTEVQNQETGSPPSPFRHVLKGSSGRVLEHHGRRLYSDEAITFDLATREVLIDCAFTRGFLLPGKALYFAARMSPYSACPDAPFLLERVGKKWELRRFIDAHDVQMDEWIFGTTIAAVVPYRSGPPFGYELLKVAGGATPPRPERGASDPNDPERKCYSELQQPLSFHAFRSGAIMVVGAARCDLGGDEGKELSDEELNLRYRPVIESFPPGRSRSTLFSLPFDELVSLIELDPEILLMIGKVREGFAENAPFRLVLVSFDGKSVRELEASLEGGQQLVAGPVASISARSEAPAPIDSSPLNGAWLLGESSLRALLGEGETLWLPAQCRPTQAWFEGTHAWVVCEDGVYTTDVDQEWIEIPQTEGDSTCETLDPRPQYFVPGMYQRGSVAGGCGSSSPRSGRSGAGKANLPDFESREFEPGLGPKPSRLPADLRIEF